MRPRAEVRHELTNAETMLNDPGKELDAYQIMYLSGVCQALNWLLGLNETEAPTKGF